MTAKTAIDINTHPIVYFLEVCSELKGLRYCGLTLDTYTKTGRRTGSAHEFDKLDLDPVGFLAVQLLRLSTGENISVQSEVACDPKMHVPLMDFVGKPSEEELDSFVQLVKPIVGGKYALFDSGRSYHIYFESIVENDKWKAFMATSLLANPAKGHPIVDWRWIGHSLLRGYGALRWSCNTDDYLKYPSLIERAHHF